MILWAYSMIQVFLEDGYYIQIQISDFDTMSPSTIKYYKPSDKWFAKKKRKGIKIRIVARLNKIFQNMKIYTLYTMKKSDIHDKLHQEKDRSDAQSEAEQERDDLYNQY